MVGRVEFANAAHDLGIANGGLGRKELSVRRFRRDRRTCGCQLQRLIGTAKLNGLD
jgi:hypothetical protein